MSLALSFHKCAAFHIGFFCSVSEREAVKVTSLHFQRRLLYSSAGMCLPVFSFLY